MYHGSPGWFGFSLFRKPAYLLKSIVILVIVQIALLAILYRFPTSTTVLERWRRVPKPVDNVEQAQRIEHQELESEG